jgi:hypothetical protein
VKVPSAATSPPITVPSIVPPLMSAVAIVPIPETSISSKFEPPETSRPSVASIRPLKVEMPVKVVLLRVALSNEAPSVTLDHSSTPCALVFRKYPSVTSAEGRV